VWAKLNSVIPDLSIDQYRKQLPTRGSLFAFGHEETKLEIWQEGAWYYWKVMRPGPAAGPEPTEEGNGAQLPRRYQRFWQSGPP
jgi:hypothetical protein